MTCKDCVHYEVCAEQEAMLGEKEIDTIEGVEKYCEYFKPKSRFVELPCEVGSKDRVTQVLVAYAQNNMSEAKTARALFMHRNTVEYHLSKAKEKYGLNPKNLFDLCRILSQAENALAERKLMK